MLGGDVNHPYPILLLVNYWEIRPSLMSARLADLSKQGISQIATFVPWQVAESDISHKLTRFLQVAAEKKMKVFLILSPEVGVHFTNSGLPKDVISRTDNMAQHCQAGKIAVNLPPNSFTLPSLFASEFNKRYYSFLGRMDGFFSDLSKAQPSLMKGVTTILTGSFWKYYRSPLVSSQTAFGGNCGDYSNHAALAYRQRAEAFFAQKEFMDPTPADANRWKNRSFEETNRRWFYQQSEDVFRNRSFQMLRKKSTHLKTLELELFTPEADPSVTYSSFLQMISGGHADFGKLSNLIDDATTRSAFCSTGTAAPFIHWTSMGGFRMLSESEKQFLILKSLLLGGGQGGGIIIDETEWLALSPTFRKRAESLARSLVDGEFQLRTQALYLAPHLWSYYGTLWEELIRKGHPNVKMIASLDLLLRESSARLLIVDPAFILTKETIQKLTGWAKAGRVVVIPRSQLYTESARIELEQILQRTKRIEIDLGMTYRLHALGDGKLVVYDLPDSSLTLKGESLSSWQSFLSAILSISEVENYCRLSDSRLSVIPFETRKDGLAVFVLNGTRRPVNADLIFQSTVQIGDLGHALSRGVDTETFLRAEENQNKDAATIEVIEHQTALTNRFALEVPPFGVLPISVEGLNLAEVREKQLAALLSEETKESPLKAAHTELPGFNVDENFEGLWN
jgi:hypothetical protein